MDHQLCADNDHNDDNVLYGCYTIFHMQLVVYAAIILRISCSKTVLLLL